MNKHLTGDLHGLASILPWRRENQGVTPGMAGRAVNDRKEENSGEHQWVYHKRTYRETEVNDHCKML